jgi:hypothetical protein
MKNLFIALSLLAICSAKAQNIGCGTSEAMQYLLDHDPKSKEEYEAFEKFTQEYIKLTQKSNTTACYVIPVVFHVYGTVQSGMAVNNTLINFAMNNLNKDFHGLNADYTSVHSQFQSIKACMPDVTFALAQLDPNGNTTTGIIYHPVAAGFGNATGYDALISADAWDNYKYMNIYIQNDLYNNNVLTNSGIAWYPNVAMTNNKTARIVYNGAYLGYNTSTEFASTLTHEYGHWLNLIHTFQGGCAAGNDNVADTPECDYSALNYTCHANSNDTYPVNCNSVTVNAENYMDYSGAYGCYKMFTAGQVARMYVALQNVTRAPLWQPSNLVATGLSQLCSATGVLSLSTQLQLNIYPNQASDNITVLQSSASGDRIYRICDALGRTVQQGSLEEMHSVIDVSKLQPAVYYFSVEEKDRFLASRKIIKH